MISEPETVAFYDKTDEEYEFICPNCYDYVILTEDEVKEAKQFGYVDTFCPLCGQSTIVNFNESEYE